MNQARSTYTRARNEQFGFTLPELLVTIAIMGILAAIAIPSWFSVSDSRNVDSATNQVIGDLRLASSKATNRLDYWQVQFTACSGNYTIQEFQGLDSSQNPINAVGSPQNPNLPSGTQVATTATVVFKPDGSANIVPSSLLSNGIASIIVKSASNGSHSETIKIDSATSNVCIQGTSGC